MKLLIFYQIRGNSRVRGLAGCRNSAHAHTLQALGAQAEREHIKILSGYFCAVKGHIMELFPRCYAPRDLFAKTLRAPNNTHEKQSHEKDCAQRRRRTTKTYVRFDPKFSKRKLETFPRPAEQREEKKSQTKSQARKRILRKPVTCYYY